MTRAEEARAALVVALAASLAEHRLDDHACDCGVMYGHRYTDGEVAAQHATHQAECAATALGVRGAVRDGDANSRWYIDALADL